MAIAYRRYRDTSPKPGQWTISCLATDVYQQLHVESSIALVSQNCHFSSHAICSLLRGLVMKSLFVIADLIDVEKYRIMSAPVPWSIPPPLGFPWALSRTSLALSNLTDRWISAQTTPSTPSSCFCQCI